jgi:GNAT superfamily N-acetyltransferase
MSKKSLYAQYLEELEGGVVIEHDYGFATCKIYDNDFYLEDIYVVPEKRDTKLGSELYYQSAALAKELGYKRVLGSIVPSRSNSTRMMHVMLGMGFKIHSSQNDIVFLYKEIE